MMNKNNLIFPSWPAPRSIHAIQTTRNGGVSDGPYASLNLAGHVGDATKSIRMNREMLRSFLPSDPVWLKQTHSSICINAFEAGINVEADASFTNSMNVVCVVMTADCLPVLLCSRLGNEVAAIHAGWKGLLNGVIESTINQMQTNPSNLLAWLGPAIGPQSFEVGNDVRDAYIELDSGAKAAFVEFSENKWLADLYKLATIRLRAKGISQIYGGEYCTFKDKEHFFSYRREGNTGRMASLIWIGND